MLEQITLNWTTMHFVHEKVALGTLITRYVTSQTQPVDILTKPL